MRKVEASPTQQYSRTYHAHAMHLAAQSTYFKARFNRTWLPRDAKAGSSNLQPSNSKIQCETREGEEEDEPHVMWNQRELVEHVEEEDLEAMDQLLRMMYSQPLPDDAPTQLLFQCLRLADRFGAVACMDLILDRLSSIPIEDMDLFLLTHAFGLPTGVCGRPSFPAFLSKCKQQVTLLFGDVPAVIRDQTLKGQFCSLPFAAVLAWAESGELLVHSENCVVYLLSAWVEAQRMAANQDEDGRPSMEELEQLAHQVRLCHLGPAYLHQILPNLDCFTDCSSMEHLPHLLAIKGNGINLDQGLKAAKPPICGWKGPKQWMAKRRRMADSRIRLSWILTADEMKERQRLGSKPDKHVHEWFLLACCRTPVTLEAI